MRAKLCLTVVALLLCQVAFAADPEGLAEIREKVRVGQKGQAWVEHSYTPPQDCPQAADKYTTYAQEFAEKVKKSKVMHARYTEILDSLKSKSGGFATYEYTGTFRRGNLRTTAVYYTWKEDGKLNAEIIASIDNGELKDSEDAKSPKFQAAATALKEVVANKVDLGNKQVR